MANTRLTQTIRNEITEAITKLTIAPVKFIELPPALSTRRSRKAAWEYLLPERLLQATMQLGEWDYGMPTMDHAEITGLLDGQPVILNLGNESNPPDITGCTLDVRFYMLPTPGLIKKHWGGTLRADFEAIFTTRWDEVRDWMRLTRDDARSAKEVSSTMDDIMRMALTAGQLKRMVPDLLKYLPDDKRQLLQEQVRASTLPFEWAAYDRNRVERAITYIAKCHMLTGIGKPVRQHLERNEQLTWCRPIPGDEPVED